MASKELKDWLVGAICRRSTLIADNAGLTLSNKELEEIFTAIGLKFIQEKLTDLYMPTVGDAMKVYADLDRVDEKVNRERVNRSILIVDNAGLTLKTLQVKWRI